MDLHTGQTVSGQVQETPDRAESVSSDLSGKEHTELTIQYIMGTMHFKLQNKIDSIGLSRVRTGGGRRGQISVILL